MGSEQRRKISNALQGDPPRQDYTQIDLPHKLSLPPLQPGGGVSAARAAAINELDDALADMNAYGTAATTAFDRYGGASEAHDLQWASVQSAALLEYNQMMGEAAITAAMKIDNVISIAASEGVTSVVMSVNNVISMQQVRDQFFLLGGILTHPEVFAPGISVSGGAGLRPSTANGNMLAQIYNTVTTLQVGNSLTQTALINVRVRRIDLPADWMVYVSPAQVNLVPGEQTTVTVSIIAGSPTPQGTMPRVAVEGYAGTQLLGGVAIDIYVSASPSQDIISLTVSIDGHIQANHQGFFQTSLYVPGDACRRSL